MKKLFSILLLSMLLFTTCKKYPEGGFLRQGPKTIVSDKRGYWQIKSYDVNGIDSTSFISNDKNLFSINSYKDVTQKKYHSSILLFFYENVFLERNKNIQFFTTGGYKSIRFDTINGINYFSRNVFCPEIDGTIWNIIKLRDKECILTNSNKNNYKIILTR